MKIFLVEDAPVIRERLHAMIRDLPGAQLVGEASTEEQAVQGIADARPDVVILDMHLENGHGLHVLRRIKAGHPAPQVIVLTNYAYPQYQKRCMALGAEYFLDKSKCITHLNGIMAQLSVAYGTSIEADREHSN